MHSKYFRASSAQNIRLRTAFALSVGFSRLGEKRISEIAKKEAAN
jgi:hypothetical protein